MVGDVTSAVRKVKAQDLQSAVAFLVERPAALKELYNSEIPRSGQKGKMKILFFLLILTMMPLPTSSARKARRQADFWGGWGEWSECSRSCGGGISFRQRRCYSQRADGGSNCIGPTRNYRLCSIQSCSGGSRDFRAEQCAEFDGTEFQGKRYKWLPYYGAPNKCELNCIPKGENFYYRHKAAVADGTPCEPGKRDVCVEGVCQAVGCDNMLSSAKKEDKCLQCGGDGRACYEVKGIFDVLNLPKGYNQIFIIPMGATSLRIKEVMPSRNFLAVKNVQGEYYLNGHWTIDFSRDLHIASTVVHYDRGSEGDLAPEQLHSRGPTTEPLVIELISQEPNQGVQYEYYLPLQGHSSGYSWSYGSWSDCSSECGGGYQSRLVFCTIDNEAYPDYMCRDKSKPASNQTCGLQACPQTKRISYIYLPRVWSHSGAWSSQMKSWKTGEWGACSATCGGGTQTRSVYCMSYNGQGSPGLVDDAKCEAFSEAPRSTQPCNMRQCATWSTGPWSECSASCGEGVQTRTVTCRTELGSQTQDFACLTEPKPPPSQPCLKENCIQKIGWHIGGWGLCSKSCDSGVRMRQVICADGDSKFYPRETCESSQLQAPATLGSCNTQPCFLPQQDPSMQDTTGYDISRWSSLTRYYPDNATTVYNDERTIQGSSRHRQLHSREDHSSNFLPLRMESHSSSSGSQQFNSHQDITTRTGLRDCSQSPHGCCSDGHTPASGPFGQGCPFSTCHQSRYGCCPDGISAAQGPNNRGCPQSYSDGHVSRNRPATASPTASQALTLQNPSDECRGSMYGCCYDNIASASGPQGEGCLNRPSQPYPVKCLLPSAQGPCSDWTTRWYFVTAVGKCNRFWYGSCHGNTNNFASEEECMRACRGSMETDSVVHQYHRGTLNFRSGSHPQEGEAQGQLQSSVGGSASHSQRGGTRESFHFSQPGPDSHTPWQGTGLHARKDGWRRTLNVDIVPESSQRTGQNWGSHHSATPGERRMDQSSQLHGRGETLVSGHSERQLTVNGQVVQHGHEQWRSSSGAAFPGADGLGHQTSPGSTLQRNLYRVILEGAESSVVEAALGQTIHLLCKAGGSSFHRTEWQKDGKPLSSDRHTYQSDSSLVISRFMAEDAGMYTCVTSNGKMESRQIQLRIKDRGSPLTEGIRGQLFPGLNHPHRDLTRGVNTVQSSGSSVHQSFMYRLRMDQNEPSVVEANIGERVRLPCGAEASPALTIQWQKDGQPVSSSRHRQQSDGALVITRVDAEDAGFFTCIASNGHGQDQQWVQLQTLGELKITGLPPSLTVSEGENARLQCMVTGNNVNVRWSRNGVPMRANGHHIHLSQDGSLMINNARPEDEGSYTCSAYRGSNSVSASTEVKVIKRPPEAVDLTRECVDQPHLANCELILQAQLCTNEYYSSFCCASCSQYQP
ncbi:papilin isoform X2 [Pelodiscus sinensis]|uniref:papilin isoform X2 n=1 Tax=Pelodiscus sinensis TaxID=13735 RepID=UPI003F6B3796